MCVYCFDDLCYLHYSIFISVSVSIVLLREFDTCNILFYISLTSLILSYYSFLFFFCFLVLVLVLFVFFFFKQKTAYEIRNCDWSSDVCSSDLCCCCCCCCWWWWLLLLVVVLFLLRDTAVVCICSVAVFLFGDRKSVV